MIKKINNKIMKMKKKKKQFRPIMTKLIKEKLIHKIIIIILA